jgi:hypothetical protein
MTTSDLSTLGEKDANLYRANFSQPPLSKIPLRTDYHRVCARQSRTKYRPLAPKPRGEGCISGWLRFPPVNCGNRHSLGSPLRAFRAIWALLCC